MQQKKTIKKNKAIKYDCLVSKYNIGLLLCSLHAKRTTISFVWPFLCVKLQTKVKIINTI